MQLLIAAVTSLGVLICTASATTNNDTKAVCYSPYTSIGDRCLLLEPHTKGTWYEMLAFCIRMNGDLLKLDDANLLHDIVEYINYQVSEITDYWIGGTDESHEGLWLWTDGSNMLTGVPLWYHCSATDIQPDGGTNQNCAALRWSSFYFIHDESCYTTRSVICETSR